MLTDLQRDILLKASEGIKEGAWCQSNWFIDPVYGELGFGSNFLCEDTIDFYSYDEESRERKSTESVLMLMARSKRCAAGEVAWQTKLIGGGMGDYEAAVRAVDVTLQQRCEICADGEYDGPADCTVSHNDSHMSGMSVDDAGLHLSEIYREAALS